MAKEIITICIGQGGVQLGESVWKQYNAEHCIASDGTYTDETKDADTQFLNFYQESQTGKYNARCIMIDTNQQTINNLKASKYSELYKAQYLLSHKFDAENNFASGRCVIGPQLINLINNKIRKASEHCDNLQGFIVKHSIGGGTGSGLGSLILENMSNDFKKLTKIGFEIFPSPTISSCIVEPYNSLLSIHYLLQYLNMSIVLDNEGIYEICQRFLDVRRPSFDNLNNLIRKNISSFTGTFRFGNKSRSVGLDEFVTNLTPFPRLHFMITSIAPCMPSRRSESRNLSLIKIVESACSPKLFSAKIADFDYDEDKYTAMYLNVSGEIDVNELNVCSKWLVDEKKVVFTEWTPCQNINVLAKKESIVALEDDDIGRVCKESVSMIGNNYAISRLFRERIAMKYDLMYSQRAFVHWYVGEGLEESDFEQARNDITDLEKEYLDTLMDQYSSDDNSEENSDIDDAKKD